MNNQEVSEIWKRKLNELREKITKLNHDKGILANLLNEAKAKQTIKFYNPLYGTELQEKISYINDWIKFHLNYVEKYEHKLKELEGAGREESKNKIKDENTGAEIKEGIRNSFKLIFNEAIKEKPRDEIKAAEAKARNQIIEGEKTNAKEKLFNIKGGVEAFKAQKPWVKYAIPFAVLLLVTASLFLFKPNISGYAVLSREATYNSSLNLKINESGSYAWDVNKAGEMKSIAATGSFSGNGTVKIYIEKDGKKYLIFDNKKLNNASVVS